MLVEVLNQSESAQKREELFRVPTVVGKSIMQQHFANAMAQLLGYF